MSPRRIVHFAAILTILTAGISLYASFTRLRLSPPLQQSYTYVGDDYPEFWEEGLSQDVLMMVEETQSYPIHGGEDARELWATSSSKGFGYVRLGEEQRAFAISMFHQFHCVRLMRAALEGRYDANSRGHMHHCLNYIRQMILCDPNLTLEPADVLSRDFDADRAGATHVCSDWSAMYDAATANWDRFADARNLSAATSISVT